MFTLAEAFHYLRTRGIRRSARKLFHGYISGRRRIYLLRSDYEALAAMPLAESGLTFRFARPDDIAAVTASFPQVNPLTFRKWLGPDYFFYLALAADGPAAFRCDTMTVSHTVRSVLRLRPDQLFMEDISTAEAFRRHGLSRQIRIAMARELLARGYRSSWGLQLPVNQRALAAFDRTPEVIERFGTLTRTCLLGRVRFSLTPSRWLSPDHVSALVELVADLVPGAAHVGLLFNPGTNKAPPGAVDAVTRASAKLGLELRAIAVTDAEDQVSAFAQEFADLSRRRADAVIVLDDPMYRDYRHTIVGLARTHRLPTLYESREFVMAGGLAAYAPPSPQPVTLPSDLDARAIAVEPLGGSRPGLAINVTTAEALGFAIPPSFPRRAAQIIG